MCTTQKEKLKRFIGQEFECFSVKEGFDVCYPFQYRIDTYELAKISVLKIQNLITEESVILKLPSANFLNPVVPFPAHNGYVPFILYGVYTDEDDGCAGYSYSVLLLPLDEFPNVKPVLIKIPASLGFFEGRHLWKSHGTKSPAALVEFEVACVTNDLWVLFKNRYGVLRASRINVQKRVIEDSYEFSSRMNALVYCKYVKLVPTVSPTGFLAVADHEAHFSEIFFYNSLTHELKTVEINEFGSETKFELFGFGRWCLVLFTKSPDAYRKRTGCGLSVFRVPTNAFMDLLLNGPPRVSVSTLEDVLGLLHFDRVEIEHTSGLDRLATFWNSEYPIELVRHIVHRRGCVFSHRRIARRVIDFERQELVLVPDSILNFLPNILHLRSADYLDLSEESS